MTSGLIVLPGLSEQKSILQGTSTVSLGDFNYFHGSSRREVRANIAALKKRLGCPQAPVVLAEQIHGCHVSRVKNLPSKALTFQKKTDSLVTGQRGVLLGILTADCVPVFLYDPEHRVVGMAHAGWRGVAKNIVPRTLRQMQRHYRTRPSAVLAGLGPHITRRRYEVDSKTAACLGIKARSNLRVDLGGILERQLAEAGVKRKNISRARLCTYGSRRLYSYRRQGKHAGRILSFLLLK